MKKPRPNIIERAMANVEATVQSFVEKMETGGPSPAERSRKIQDRIQGRIRK